MLVQQLRRTIKGEKVKRLFWEQVEPRKRRQKAKPMTIGALNVKNIETNDAFVCELLKIYDILALQEHWLFNFQLPDIEKRFPSHSAHIRAVDDDNPLTPHKSQGDSVGLPSCTKKIST